MEEVLKTFNADYVSLSTEEVRNQQEIFETILEELVFKMRTMNPLFNAMFRDIFYGGGFYDGLSVGQPKDFDLDLLLVIPKMAKPKIIESTRPGYVFLQAKEIDAWKRQPEAQPAYDKFDKLFDDDDYLDGAKAKAWIHSVVQKCLNEYQYANKGYIVHNHLGEFKLKLCEAGPAFTLNIRGQGVDIYVDLVPSFVFRDDKWPKEGYIENPFPSSKPEFFIVPKKPKNSSTRLWRLSFQQQERLLIHGKHRLKPAIRLLKALRTSLDHKPIASYFIKTVALHVVDKKDESFWNGTLTEAFMTMLKEYRDFLKSGNIPYYWCRENNLLENASESTLENYSGYLSHIIRDIENHPENPRTILKYFLRNEDSSDSEEETSDDGKCSIL